MYFIFLYWLGQFGCVSFCIPICPFLYLSCQALCLFEVGMRMVASMLVMMMRVVVVENDEIIYGKS